MSNFELSRSGFIHLSRWIAAFLVVISHLRSMIFVDFKDVVNKTPITKIFYFVTGLGHQSVIVFFVLSGYLIGRSVMKQIDENRFSWRNYGLNRFTRLYSVLFVALILTFIFDLIGSKYDLTGIYVGKQNLATLPFNVMEHQTISHFLSSLFMLQGTLLEPYGSNGPLWSLANEFWYYIIFPLNALLIYNIRNAKFKVLNIGLNLLLTIAIILFLSNGILAYYTVWLAGVAAFYLKKSFPGSKVITPVLLVGYLVYIRLIANRGESIFFDLVLSIIFMLWLISYKEYKLENSFFRLNEKIASFSYTLYLVHFPFSLMALTVINNYTTFGFSMQPSLISYLLVLIMLVACVCISLLIANFTEFKTDQFKRAIQKHLLNKHYTLGTAKAVL